MAAAQPTEMPQLLLPGANEYAANVTKLSQAIIKSTSNMLNQAYGADELQKLDIYLPRWDKARKDGSVLIFFHGGAWRSGCKEWMGFMAPPFLELASIFVAPGYRLAPENKYPDQLHDALSAVSWVYRNIAEFGGNPEKIYIGGHSAGGYLASLVALRRDLYSQYGLPDHVIRYCFPISAPFDLSRVSDRILDEYLADRSICREGSPIKWIDEHCPPFFLSYGQLDIPNVIADNRAMIELMQKSSASVSWIECAGASHFDTHAHCVEFNHPWRREITRILTGGSPRQGNLAAGVDSF